MSTKIWTVHPHDEIEHLEPNLWSVSGNLPNMGLRRRMVIVKRDDGDLVIHNGVALREEAMAEIEAWGRPAYLIVPNGWHRLDAAAFKERYPTIQVFCPKGAISKVTQKVDIHGDYSSFPKDATISVQTLDGSGEGEGVFLIRSQVEDAPRHTLLFNDAIFNQPHLPGFSGFIMRLMGSTGGPKVTRVMRWLGIKQKTPLKEHLLRLADTPNLVRIIVAHGNHIETNPADILREIAETL